MPSNTTQLDKARQLYQAKDLESAAALLESLVKELPIDHRALRLLFKVYTEERRWVGPAERTYRRLLSAGLPESQLYTLHLDMARVYHAAGQAPQSLEVIEKAIALNPSIREAYDLLVQVHESRNSLARATETLQHSVAQQQDNADLRSVLAKTYEKMGWWVEARDAAKTAIRLKPKMAEPQHILRRVDKQLKSNPRLFQEAAKRRQAAGDIEGMLRVWFAWAEATQEADDFVAVGELCEQHGQLGRAEYAFNRAINLRRDHLRAREGLRRVQLKKQPPVPLDKPIYDANELEQLCQWFIQCGDVAGVISFLRSYLVRHPDFVPALRFLARAYQEAGKHDAATRTLQEAIDKSFDAAKANLYCELGAVYLARGRKTQAKQAFHAALRYQREHSEAKRQLAVLSAAEVPPTHVLRKDWEQFRASGRYKEALEYYQNFIDIDPFNPHPYIFRSHAYEKLGHIDKAYQANKSAALLIYTDDAFVKLGEFCAYRGLYAEAAEAFELALKINERNVEARRKLARIPHWMTTSQEERLQSRIRKPNSQYLYAIWNLSKRENLVGEAVKYFAALADVMVDEPTLFSLLGQANEAYGVPRAAAVAYRHKAALQGTAKEYVKLGDFCFRHPGLDAMAVETYQAALELNPFYSQARNRLSLLRPSRFLSPTFITGHPHREDSAHDLCEVPGDRGKADKLRTQFIESKAMEYAEVTYRLLQGLHPEQSVLMEDLAQIYLACGKPQLAWLEVAGAEVTQIGEEGLPYLVEPVPPVASVAPTIATEWYLYPPTAVTTQAESVQLAEEHVHQARQASVSDVMQLRHFLAAASLYQRTNRPDKVLDCLVSYGKAMVQYHRTCGKTDLARDLAIEAMRLAVSQTRDISGRQTKLASYILDYFKDLEEEFGTPRAWPEAIYTESKTLLVEAAKYECTPLRLSNLLALIKVFLSVLRQPTVDQEYQGPIHRAAVIQRRAATILQVSDHERLSAMLKRWIADTASVNGSRVSATKTKRAQLRLLSPQLSPLQASAHDLELRVTIRNSRDTPADCVRVTLKERLDLKVTKPRQFIPFLPGGTASSVAFELTAVPDHLRCVEFNISLDYFDPVDPQRESIRPVLVLQAEEQRRLADEIWECLSKAIEVNQAYQADKARYETERANGFGDPHFFRRQGRYLRERSAWLSEAQKKLAEEYGEERRLLDLLLTDSPEQTIREALKATVRSRGLDETQFQQISGDGGDILSQVALYIRDLTTLAKEQKGGYLMGEWISILKGAAEIAASAKTLGDVAENILSWFEKLIRPSGNQQAKKVWEDFKRDPERNKGALARVAAQLEPDRDPVLKGYVLGVARQKLQANRGQLYILLSGSRYTLSQVQDICARLNPALPGLGPNPSQQEAARWAVIHAATQEQFEDTLISAMVETNPEVITDIVKLT